MPTINTTPNITTLKALLPPTDGTVIYVEGYYTGGDGGGGMFRYYTGSNTQLDFGINFKPNGVISGPGRWVRQYYGHLNVAYFGIVKHPEYDTPSGPKNHERLQNVIDYCYRNQPSVVPDDISRGDFTIYFPEGVYWLAPTTSIILRTHTHIKGDTSTIIRLREVNIDYLFKTDIGHTRRLSIEQLKFDLGAELPGHNNPTGWLYAKAVETIDGDMSGGIYGATFRDIYVENVGNHGIHFEGGQFNALDPKWSRRCHQFIYFDNVWVERRYNYMNSFRLIGQNVNFSFTNCNPSVPTYSESLPTLRGACWHVESNIANPPGNNESIVFSGCDAGGAPGQPGEFGFYIKNAQNIIIQNSWIESSEWGIVVENSKAVSILDNHFANAAANGSLPDTMYPQRNTACIKSTKSSITVERNDVLVTDPSSPYMHNQRFIIGDGAPDDATINIINSRNNVFQHQVLSQTYGITQYATIKSVTARFLNPLPSTPPPLPPVSIMGIDISEKKVVMVKIGTGGANIFRINSTITAGETLYLYAQTGNIVFNAMSIGAPEYGGKNIGLGGASTFTLLQGKGVAFMKVDGVNGYETASYQLMTI